MDKQVSKLVHGQVREGPIPKRQAGLTLIEAVAFLAIAGLVIAGALMMYNAARTEQATQRTVSEYEGIKTALKSMYSGHSYGTSLLNGILINSQRLPGTLRVSANNTITNDFDGGVVVQGQDNRFVISYANVPRAVCIGLLSGVTRSGDWVGYTVANTTDAAPGASTNPADTINSAITPSAADQACTVTGATALRVSLWAS